jgi:hypothetical protein
MTNEYCDAEIGEPSPQRILELTAEIRRRWSRGEHRRRARIARVAVLEMPIEPRRRSAPRERAI